jgi:phospholipid/cholesterol/gamma-HCH transport system substrate-binding protein
MKFGLEAKVGVFVVLSLILIGYMTTKVGDISFGKQKGNIIKAYLNNASGLEKDAIVKFKGVDVGYIKDIKLEDSKVALELVIKEGVILPSNLRVSVRASGFLGEKFLELEQLGEDSASTSLKNGDVITNSKESVDFDQLSAKLGDIADQVNILVKSLNDVFSSQEGKENMTKTLENVIYSTESLKTILEENQKKINTIVNNVEQITDTISKMTIANQSNINELIAYLTEVSKVLKSQTPEIANKVNNITGNIDNLIADSKGDLKETVKNMKTVTAKLEKSVDNINAITDKINKGDGTIGTLLNDNETAKDVKETVKGLKNMVTQFDRFKFYLSFSGEKMWDTGETKGYFKVKVQPRKDKYYLLGLATSTGGKEYITNTNYTYTGDLPYYIDGNTGSTYSNYSVKEVKRKENSLTFIAQYVQRFYDRLDLRIGLMESEFGLGADYFPFDDEKLQFSLDAYDFSDSNTDRKPHMKTSLYYNFTKNLYLNVGYDDFLNSDTKSGFIGAGLIFLDEDLKYLFGKVPLPTN